MWGSDPEIKVKVNVKVKVKTSAYRGEGKHFRLPDSIHPNLRRMKSGPPRFAKGEIKTGQ